MARAACRRASCLAWAARSVAVSKSRLVHGTRSRSRTPRRCPSGPAARRPDLRLSRRRGRHDPVRIAAALQRTARRCADHSSGAPIRTSSPRAGARPAKGEVPRPTPRPRRRTRARLTMPTRSASLVATLARAPGSRPTSARRGCSTRRVTASRRCAARSAAHSPARAPNRKLNDRPTKVRASALSQPTRCRGRSRRRRRGRSPPPMSTGTNASPA